MEESIGFDVLLAGDFRCPRLNTPTCRDLGIECVTNQETEIHTGTPATSPISYNVAKQEYTHVSSTHHYSPHPQIPLSDPYSGYYCLEPAFVRRRNERERERVRCVNDGYSRLREHLPLENKEKRISKVETLRGAINYITYLKKLLGDDVSNLGVKNEGNDKATPETRAKKTRKSVKRLV